MKTIYTLILILSFFSQTAGAQSVLTQSQMPSAAAAATSARPGFLPRYNYEVTDIATRGLKSETLFNDIATSARWMELHHSVCSNRALVWSYDLFRKRNLQPGRIFIFFGANVWANDRKGWHYHAGTYVMENGAVKVLEGSYPDETQKPQSIVEWMDTEMEGRADATKCRQIDETDTDLTQYYYQTLGNLPEVRKNGKPGAPCYYRLVPGYIAYPYQVAEIELGRDSDGRKAEPADASFDLDLVYGACIDAYAARDPFKRGAAKSFCQSYLRY